MHFNQATGVVTFEIAGVEFQLRATFANLAEWQARAKVPGINTLTRLVQIADARILLTGCKTLCVSDNADAFDDLPLLAHLGSIVEALSTALQWALPVEESKTPAGAKKKKRPTTS